MANETTRILGLDPGLRRTGWGVIESEGSRLRWIAHGVAAPPEKAPFPERLLHLLSILGVEMVLQGKASVMDRESSPGEEIPQW